MVSGRYKLFTSLRDRYGFPIYTLRLPGLRVYVVNDRSLISAIERSTRTLSFAPIEAQAAAAVLGTSKVTNEIMAHDPGSDQNHFAVFRKAVRPVLAPGPHLNAMFQRSFQTMSLSLDAQLTSAEPTKVDLLAWIRHEITLAGTDAEYGEANPFRDPSIEESWHILARERLVQRFLDYFEQAHHITGGSGAVHTRLRHNAAAGMPLADTARGEVGACMAFLNNTVPGAFWVLYHMYADPAVLRHVREELLAHAVVKDDDDNDNHHTLNVDSVLSACPILKSTVHEVFRVRGIGTGMVRRVLADQRLGDSGYLLKKGALVFAPNSVQHQHLDRTRAWSGADCDRFDHRRFLQPNGGGGLKGTSALRIFGGGGVLLPRPALCQRPAARVRSLGRAPGGYPAGPWTSLGSCHSRQVVWLGHCNGLFNAG
ncbi:25-hydroxycholesterol 7-alpha-hydroxylase [Apiospora saccharicola]